MARLSESATAFDLVLITTPFDALLKRATMEPLAP
jgi:hypothetical protein